MVNGKAKLVVDLGNSETRVKTYYGTTAKGKPRCKLSVLDNRYYDEMTEDAVQLYLNGQIYTEEDSAIFRHEVTTDDGLVVEEKIVCNGMLCNDEFGAKSTRPSSVDKKYKNILTKYTLMNALRRGYEDIAEFTNCDMSSINVEWQMVLLLPPDDIDKGAGLLAEMAKSIKKINFDMPKLEKDIVVDGVTVYPEGFCALIGTILESKTKIRKSHEYLLEEDTYTLIVDIGAGTTDIMLAKGQNIISTSRFTKEVGGNSVHQVVRRNLKNNHGISLPDIKVREGCETGVIKSGGKKFSIIEEIAKAKSEVAKQLVDAVQEFFESNMMSVQMINNLLVCGGGAVNSDIQGIEPISKYIVEYMKRLSENINLVDIPKEVVDGEEREISARLLNVIGAGILAE